MKKASVLKVRTCVCGHHLGTADRFCARCGVPIGHEQDGPENAVLLSGVASDGVVRSESEVRSPARLRSLLVCLPILALILIGLSQWRSGVATSNPGDLSEPEAPEDENAAEDSDVSDAAADEPQAAEPPNDEDEVVVEEASPRPEAEPPADADSRADGPILGEETGLGVILGRSTNQGLRLLDLDSGMEYELAARGELVGIVGESFVLRSGSRLRLVGLDSLDNEGQELVTDARGYIEAIAFEDDLMWVLDTEVFGSSEDAVAMAFNDSGDQIDEYTFDVVLGFPVWNFDRDLVQTAGGGIYRNDNNDFRRLSIGSLVAVGEQIALVLECDDRMQCRRNWYDKDEWGEPLDLPEPPFSGRGWTTIDGQDRWLTEINWNTQQISLVEIATGEVVRMVSQEMQNLHPSQGIPISSDGRWLLEPQASGVLFIDLDTGAEFPYSSDGVSWGLSGIFVDLDDVGFIP